MLAFYNMLDTMIINAKTLWCFKQDEKNNKSKHLVMPFISQRKISGLQKPVLMKIDYVLPIEPERPKSALKKTHEHHGSRCRICLGHCTTKAEKNNMDAQHIRKTETVRTYNI